MRTNWHRYYQDARRNIVRTEHKSQWSYRGIRVVDTWVRLRGHQSPKINLCAESAWVRGVAPIRVFTTKAYPITRARISLGDASITQDGELGKRHTMRLYFFANVDDCLLLYSLNFYPHREFHQCTLPCRQLFPAGTRPLESF